MENKKEIYKQQCALCSKNNIEWLYCVKCNKIFCEGCSNEKCGHNPCKSKLNKYISSKKNFKFESTINNMSTVLSEPFFEKTFETKVESIDPNTEEPKFSIEDLKKPRLISLYMVKKEKELYEALEEKNKNETFRQTSFHFENIDNWKKILKDEINKNKNKK